MNSFLKWFFRFVVFVLVISLITVVAGYFILKRSIPDYDIKDPIAYGDYEAEIIRDLQAVPHIYGATENDALFALGYAHAQDRLWQMESSRRAVQGRLSELFGEDTLEIDKYFRALDLWNLADRASLSLSESDMALLQAYSDGVNAYVQDINRNKRGSGSPEFLFFGREFSPWTPTDSMAIMKLMALRLTSSAQHEILRARLASELTAQDMQDIFYNIQLPPHFDQLTFQNTQQSHYKDTPRSSMLNPVAPIDMAGASNAFVAAPARTSSKAAILANDPHLELTAPSIWMLAHMHFNNNDEDIYGGTIPGIPLILIGHNDNLAWGLTTSYLDDQDLVVLKRADGGYDENGTVIPFESETIFIDIEGADAPYQFTREVSQYGPVIPNGGPLKVETALPEGHAMALTWTALIEDDHSIVAGLNMMRAKNVNEAIIDLRDFVAPSQIFSLADKTGNIAQIAAGLLPLRAENNPSKGLMPVPSWLDGAGFDDFIPYNENPRLINPEDGLLIHTNNKFIEGTFPYHFSYDWGDVYRRLRSGELLQTRPYHTSAGFSEAQNDEISDAARVLLPLIARDFWFQPNQDKTKSDILQMLANWNGEYDALRAEPLIFAAWLEELNALVFSDELGPLFDDLGRVEPLRLERVFRNVDGAAHWCDIRPTPEVETCSEIAEAALDRAIAKLTESYGPNFEEWRWGRAHHAVHKNTFLSEVPVVGGLTNIVQEQSGDTQTLLRLAYPGGLDYDFDANHGAGLRMVVDFSDLEHSKIIIATGQSGHILSPHYDDLSTIWRTGDYILMSTNRQVIEGNQKGRIVFSPDGDPLEGN